MSLIYIRESMGSGMLPCDTLQVIILFDDKVFDILAT